MAAWVRDLQLVGYTFPKVRAAPSNTLILAPGARPTPRPAPQLTPAPLPRTPQAWRRHRDIILVIVFNSDFPGWLEVPPPPCCSALLQTPGGCSCRGVNLIRGVAHYTMDCFDVPRAPDDGAPDGALASCSPALAAG